MFTAPPTLKEKVVKGEGPGIPCTTGLRLPKTSGSGGAHARRKGGTAIQPQQLADVVAGFQQIFQFYQGSWKLTF